MGKTEDMKREVEEFCVDFETKFGVRPSVIVPIGVLDRVRLPLRQLEKVADRYVYMEGKTLRSKTRKTEVMLPRQIFYKIALDMGYGSTYIASHMGFDHATVLHGRTAINARLSVEDKEVTLMFNQMQQDITNKLTDAGMVFTNSSKGSHPKSGVSPELDEDETAVGSDD
jgi:hypothetical protein